MTGLIIWGIVIGATVIFTIDTTVDAAFALFRLPDGGFDWDKAAFNAVAPLVAAVATTMWVVPFVQRRKHVLSDRLFGRGFAVTAAGIGLTALFGLAAIAGGIPIGNVRPPNFFWSAAIFSWAIYGLFLTTVIEAPFRETSNETMITPIMVLLSTLTGWWILGFTLAVFEIL